MGLFFWKAHMIYVSSVGSNHRSNQSNFPVYYMFISSSAQEAYFCLYSLPTHFNVHTHLNVYTIVRFP